MRVEIECTDVKSFILEMPCRLFVGDRLEFENLVDPLLFRDEQLDVLYHGHWYVESIVFDKDEDGILQIAYMRND